MNKAKLILVLIIFAVGALVLSRASIKNAVKNTSIVDKISAKQDERSQKILQSRFAVLISKKNWDEIDNTFDSSKDALEWGDALDVVQVKDRSTIFTAEEKDKLLTLTLNALEAKKKDPQLLLSTLLRAAKRLPGATLNSANEKKLKGWVQERGIQQVLVEFALKKLVVDGGSQDRKTLQLFSENPNPERIFSIHALSRTDEQKRSQKILLKQLLKNFKNLEPRSQEVAIVVLSAHSEIDPASIKSLMWSGLDSKEKIRFEPALKAATNLIQQRKLSSVEIKKLDAKLDDILKSRNTPFARIKIADLKRKMKSLSR